MKKLMITFIVAFAFQAQARELRCNMTDTNARPWLQFVVELKANLKADVYYYEYPFFGAEVVSVKRPVEGCQDVDVFYAGMGVMSYECDGDGDAGYTVLHYLNDYLHNGKMDGTFYFPESNGPGGYGDDAELKVVCQ